MRPVLLVGLTVAGVVTGCSSSHPAPPSEPAKPQGPLLQWVACPASLRTAFSSNDAADSVSVQTDVAAGFTTCGYRTSAVKAGACTAATVTINTNPQPYKDFQRWVVETGQNSVTGPGLAPIAVMGIGIEANWVPGILTFGTATNERWVSVRLTCPTPGPQSLALAKDLARAALAAK